MSFDLSISVAGKVSYFEVNFSYVGLGNNVSLTYALQISAILPASFIFFMVILLMEMTVLTCYSVNSR